MTQSDGGGGTANAMTDGPTPVALPPPVQFSIWWSAFGYFACYAPYSAFTKALTDGRLRGMPRRIPSFELLPSTVLSSFIGMFVFLTAMRWWKYAGRARVGGFSFPAPSRWTLLSGICTSAIVVTTTLAYTFHGVSIVFMMLLMRGGVLIIAPVVDLLSGRRTRWFSWIALCLSISALFVSFFMGGGRGSSRFNITTIATLDVIFYLLSYFIRLRFMSRQAKSDDPNANVRYFVEEQMVATPFALLMLGALAIVGQGEILMQIRHGFTTFWSEPIVPQAIMVGLLSQGTGIFGGLILLDKRENTFCVPVNRCSSVLAGVLASYGLMWSLSYRAPATSELVGAAMIVTAIVFLTIPPMLERARLRAAGAPSASRG